jgi:hypothetical protein
MRYRDIEYTVVQGIERGVWKWSASVAGVVIKGHAAIKSKAVQPRGPSTGHSQRRTCGSSRPKKKTIDLR